MHDHYTAHTNARGNQPIYLSVALVLILLITLFGPTPSLGAESSTPPRITPLFRAVLPILWSGLNRP